MKKLFFSACLAFFLTAGSAYASDPTFEAGLRVNHETIDANFDVNIPSSLGSVVTGVGATINDEEFKYGSAKLAVKNSQFTPGIQYSLGFKGLYGEAYDNRRGGPNKDSDLAVIGFFFGADYEIPTSMNPIPVPITTGASITLAPKPLCFQETDTYYDFGMGLKFHIIRNAMITFDYKFSDMDFEEDSGYDWDKKHHMVLLGYTIKF